ncbi:MAG: hypothetical protein FJ087_15670, partial [Deltaproteobacteria bacterium]|nr:hypothetical protein [Deltaproteobacteria bacterium]
GQGGGFPVLDSWRPAQGVVTWFVWTGQEARTPDLVRAFREWRSREPAAWASLLGRMAAACESLATAQDAAAFVAGVHRYGALLAELGRAAGIDVVPESAVRIADAASRCGGAAKPSGAGGGDLVVAAFPPGVDDRPFRDEVEAMGGRFVPLSVAARGVHLERGAKADSLDRGG